MRPMLTCSSLAAGCALALSACSSASRIAAGPVASYSDHHRRDYGGEVLGRAAVGTSDGESFGAFQSTARARITGHTQLVDGGFGPTWFERIGPLLGSAEITPLLGLGRFDERIITVGSLRGAVGLGSARSRTHVSSPGTRPDVVDPMMDGSSRASRQTTSITLELASTLDAPVTRGVEYTFGLLIGVAWLEESYIVETPPPLFRPGVLLLRTREPAREPR